jgi:hypothetical protein
MFKSAKIIKRIREEDNVINCLEYNPQGMRFATGGQDSNVNFLFIIILF